MIAKVRPMESGAATMAWVDALPEDKRALVNEHGVWPVHLALGRGLSVDDARAALNDAAEWRRQYLCEFK